jgi:hypothetical protein
MTSPPSWGQAHQGPGGPGPYGGEHGMWEPARPPRNGMGVAALTLGLVGALLFWTVLGGVVLGLLALIFGVVGHRRGSRGEATNGTLAVVGAVIGALALVGSTIVLVFVVSVLSSGDYGELESCVRDAATQSEQEQCQRDFVDSISP